MPYDLVIQNGTIATASDVFQADIGIRDGVIVQIGRDNKPRGFGFVTFDDESGQRHSLSALQQGSLPSAMDVAIGLEPDQYFRGKDPTCGGKFPNHRKGEVLSLEEACEPDEIIFQNIGLASPDQRAMQKLVMLLWLLVFMGLEYSLVKAMDADPSTRMYSGLVITTANSLTPELLHVFSDLFEVHETDASKITSVYNKISLFRKWSCVCRSYIEGALRVRL